ncbi:hypothetical protein GQ42DRAFT_161362 [Ramicandelaber brevisporus]|nr:hypothetical protein GQ42DRAFT_161362 [Ramicandelaber brevisporus]
MNAWLNHPKNIMKVFAVMAACTGFGFYLAKNNVTNRQREDFKRKAREGQNLSPSWQRNYGFNEADSSSSSDAQTQQPQRQ